MVNASDFMKDNDPIEGMYPFWKPEVGDHISCVLVSCDSKTIFNKDMMSWVASVIEDSTGKFAVQQNIILPNHANLEHSINNSSFEPGDILIIKRVTDELTKSGSVVFQYNIWDVKRKQAKNT